MAMIRMRSSNMRPIISLLVAVLVAHGARVPSEEGLASFLNETGSGPTQPNDEEFDELVDEILTDWSHEEYGSARMAPALTSATKHNWGRISTQIDNYARVATCFGMKSGAFLRNQLLTNHVKPGDSDEKQDSVLMSALASVGAKVKDTVTLKDYREAIKSITEDGNFRLTAQEIVGKAANKLAGHFIGIGVVALVTVLTHGIGTIPALLIYTGVSWGAGYVAEEGVKVITSETWMTLCEAFESDKVADGKAQPPLTSDDERHKHVHRYLNGVRTQ